MTKADKILLGVALILTLGIVVYISRPATAPTFGAGLNVAAFSTTSTATQATTTLYAFAGTLHTISVTKPVSGSVITIYDSATTTAPTVAPLVITITTSTVAPFTLTIDGEFNNGLTIQQSTATSTINVTYQGN